MGSSIRNDNSHIKCRDEPPNTNEDRANFSNDDNQGPSGIISNIHRNQHVRTHSIDSLSSQGDWEFLDSMENGQLVRKCIQSQEKQIRFLRAEIHTKNDLIDSLLKIINVLMTGAEGNDASDGGQNGLSDEAVNATCAATGDIDGKATKN